MKSGAEIERSHLSVRADLGLRRLAGNIASTLGRQTAANTINLGIMVLLARALGPQGNGQYSLALLLPTMLGQLLNLGVSSANIYFVGRRPQRIGTAKSATLFLWLALSTVGLLVAAPIVIAFGAQMFPGTPVVLLLLGGAAFPLTLLQSYLGSLLCARQDFRHYNLAQLSIPVVTLAVVVVTVTVLSWGVVGALIAFMIGNGTGIVLSSVYMLPHRTATLRGSISTYVRHCIGYGWKAHAGNVSMFVNYRLDLFLVNLWLTPAAVGVYVISIQIAERLWVLSQASSTVLFPRLAELFRDDKAPFAQSCQVVVPG